MFGIFRQRRPVTLVLGGGSARGMAHIGVLKVLEQERIPIDNIIGASMGALIGATYAVGVPISRIEERALKFSVKKLLDPTLPRMGLLAGDRLEKIIVENIEGRSFTDCRIPLEIVTTDIETGQELIHRKGNLAKLLRASCSWPGIFNPVRIDGRLLVDGGIKNSVPTALVHDRKNTYIVAVDVGFCVKHGKIDSIFQMILQSVQILGHELNKYQAREADTTITVPLGDIDQAAFHRTRDAIAIGYRVASEAIPKIKRDLRMGA